MPWAARVPHPNGVSKCYLGSQDTFNAGTLNGVGRVYQQTYVVTYAKTVHAKLYAIKTPDTETDIFRNFLSS